MFRAAAVPAFVIALAIGMAGAEPPESNDIAGRLSQLELLQAQSPESPGAARDAWEDQLERMRAGLIDAAPDDDRAATWLLDSAAYWLRIAQRKADDTSVLFGLPLEAQRTRVDRSAGRALTLIERAEPAAAAAIARLESRLLEPELDADRAAALAAQIEPALARLVEVELGLRLPILKAEAAVLRAVGPMPAPERAKTQKAALELLAAAPVPAAAAFVAEARKRLLVAAVLLASGDGQQRSAARRQIEWIVSSLPKGAESPDATLAALDPAAWVQLHMALILCGAAEDSARLPCPGRGEDWLVDLLLAEARVREARDADRAADSPAMRAALTALLDVARTHGHSAEVSWNPEHPPDALHKLVYDKLAIATGPGTPWASLDAEIALARAWFLRNASDRLDAEAAALLAHVSDRTDAPAAIRARALWLAAGSPTGADEDDGLRRWRLLARLVHELPQTRLALVAARELAESTDPPLNILESCDAMGGAAPPTRWPDERARLDVLAAVRLLAAAAPDDAAAAGALVVMLLSAPAGSAAAEFAEAVDVFARIDPASAVRARAESCITQALERAMAIGLSPRELEAVLSTAAGWFAGRADADAHARALDLRLQRAELALASRLEEPAQTVESLRALLDTPIDAAGEPTRARLRTALGAAMRRAGDTEAAFTALRAVAEEFERDAHIADRVRKPARAAFWCAWAEMLEILREQAAGDAQSDSAVWAVQARRHRERLEVLDPDLGGEPWAGRIRAATGAGSK